ncbi:hypothetical protein RJ639_033677 [Escallonia herrerae]|uniref:methionine--tRNA ligase n=1 Tax=Escallonia herrerae TaxID=1293975 RepID=A0AA88WUP8_9ASTE|nr:hypothetical protein RJ639_033677 [Escallonia herrerae]
MAVRVQHSIQRNGLRLLSSPSLYNSIHSSRKNRTHFRPKWNPPSSRGALYCTCTRSEQEPFVLTTPLYYRLLSKKVVFITGTDEHGEKIATAAAAQGSSPSEHCAVVSQAYKALWNDLDIAYDKFIRTTDPKHEAIVKEFYSKVLASGDIYRADYEGLYCVNCEDYKVDENELLENNSCPLHLKPCDLRKEDNYFFALSKYQKRLEETLVQSPDFVQPSFRLNEVQSWIRSGLKRLLYFPSSGGLGYISALSEDEEQPNLQAAVSSGWPASLHLIGKDILRFHAVYWPAMLMSAGLSLPKKVFGHGFLTKDGMKMGKSLGNTLEPNDLVDRFGSDAIRYFFIREVEFGNDGDYSEDRFINISNAHLANTIGNLLNRTLGLLKKNCKSTLAFDSAVAAEGNAFKENVEKLVEKARLQYEKLSLSSACEAVLEIGNAGNVYIDERAPWSLFKQGDAAFEAAAKDLVIVLEAMRIIAIALSPKDTKWGGLKGGQVMAQPTPVFAKVESRLEGDGTAMTNKVGKKKERRQQSQGLAEA